MPPHLVRALVTAAAICIALSASANEVAVQIPTRPGITVAFAFDSPPEPKAVAVLFSGGDGVIGVSGVGDKVFARSSDNFLIRSRGKFRDAGLAYAAVDAPSDHHDGMPEWFRAGSDNAADIAHVLGWLRQKAAAPIWLVGTSMGSISAAAVAARLKGGFDGLVLTSTVSLPTRRAPGGGVATLALDRVGVPTLVMDHTAEACKAVGSPQAIARRLTGSPRVAVSIIDGGDPPRSGPCEGLSPHGYLGAEDKAVSAIVAFMLAR
jgi:predicted alpha/beta-hydrolase family hydrolase